MGYHWNVQRVGDANDLEQLEQAFTTALKDDERPSLIIMDSHIAYGAPHKQDTSAAHGEPLGEEEIRATKVRYDWDPDKHFYMPEEVKSRPALYCNYGSGLEDATGGGGAWLPAPVLRLAEHWGPLRGTLNCAPSADAVAGRGN
jgi:transketolase